MFLQHPYSYYESGFKRQNPVVRIYDCSNSPARPPHRGYGGAKENACVTLLKECAARFNCEFVDNLKEADVVFTNDVFPEDVLASGLPRVKRMDGIFWQLEHKERNEPYNTAAQLANHVIFVSEYSRRSYYQLCGKELRSESVALNWVNMGIFYPKGPIKDRPTQWITAATSWDRPEKRMMNMYDFAEILRLRGCPPLQVVGHPPTYGLTEAQHINYCGYVEQNALVKLLHKADAFVNLSYRDASPKVVAEAISCGLPVLYANSGGTQELVPYGVRIPDAESYGFQAFISGLEHQELVWAYTDFCACYKSMRQALLKSDVAYRRESAMLTHYFTLLRSVATSLENHNAT